MKYISTTDLRTKSSQLVNDLKSGEAVSLIHRSEVVGVITPSVPKKAASSLQKMQDFLRLAAPSRPIDRKRREEVYRQHMDRKYGQDIS